MNIQQKQKLIIAFETIIRAINSNSVDYDWSCQQSCNCGVLCQILTDNSKDELTAKYNWRNFGRAKRTWTEHVQEHCSITGKTTNEILNILLNVGLTQNDICDLEFLSNSSILKRTDIFTGSIYKRFLFIFKKQLENNYYKNPKNLAKYLNAWIKILEEEINEEGVIDDCGEECQERITENIEQ